MQVIGWMFAAVAAGIHGYIFVLESLRWTLPETRAVFGTTEKQAEDSRMLAYNQGFYNLFLALMAVAGIVLGIMGHDAVGATLIFAGCGSMVLAGLVLLASSRGAMLRPASIQILPAAIGIVCTAIALA